MHFLHFNGFCHGLGAKNSEKRHKSKKHVEICYQKRSYFFVTFRRLSVYTKQENSLYINILSYTSRLQISIRHLRLSSKISHMSSVNISTTGHHVRYGFLMQINYSLNEVKRKFPVCYHFNNFYLNSNIFKCLQALFSW